MPPKTIVATALAFAINFTASTTSLYAQVGERPTPSMADVKHLNHLTVHRKQDPIDVWLAAVEELADLYGRITTLGRHGTAQGKLR